MVKRISNIFLSSNKQWKQLLVIFVVYSVWCSAVLLYIISLKGLDVLAREYGSLWRFYFEFVHNVIKGTLVYYILIFKLGIPFVKKQNRRRIIAQALLFFALLTVYEYVWSFHFGSPTVAERSHFTYKMFFLFDFILDLLMIGVALFVATLIKTNQIQKQKDELEMEKLQAELSAIKYQINPHFLFNSLSFIYTKTVRQSPEAAHAVHLLSEIMNYALGAGDDQGMVPLLLEVDHLKKVIEMNQVRFGHTLNIQYEEHIGENQAFIPILVLVTLVENAFKHGDLNDDKNKVLIRLIATPYKIQFFVQNKKKSGPKEPSSGIGLNNVRKRLELMYGDQHTFTVREDTFFYSNEITINL